MKGLFKVGDSLSLTEYFEDPRVITEAERVARSVKPGQRSKEAVFVDCLNGLALQYAVMDNLITRNINATEATKREYDLIITAENGSQTYYDVKGIFKSGSKTYSQTAWEVAMVPRLKHPVYYLCFDCRTGATAEPRCRYEGWTDQNGFQPSIYYSGSFIYATELNKE